MSEEVTINKETSNGGSLKSVAENPDSLLETDASTSTPSLLSSLSHPVPPVDHINWDLEHDVTGEVKNFFSDISEEQMSKLDEVLSLDEVQKILQQTEGKTDGIFPSTSEPLQLEAADLDEEIIKNNLHERDVAKIAVSFNDHAYALTPKKGQRPLSAIVTMEPTNTIATPESVMASPSPGTSSSPTPRKSSRIAKRKGVPLENVQDAEEVKNSDSNEKNNTAASSENEKSVGTENEKSVGTDDEPTGEEESMEDESEDAKKGISEEENGKTKPRKKPKPTRRSTRISEHEQREMAEKIRQENLRKEKEEMKALIKAKQDERLEVEKQEAERLEKEKQAASESAESTEEEPVEAKPEEIVVFPKAPITHKGAGRGRGKKKLTVKITKPGAKAAAKESPKTMKGRGKGRGRGKKSGTEDSQSDVTSQTMSSSAEEEAPLKNANKTNKKTPKKKAAAAKAQPSPKLTTPKSTPKKKKTLPTLVGSDPEDDLPLGQVKAAKNKEITVEDPVTTPTATPSKTMGDNPEEKVSSDTKSKKIRHRKQSVRKSESEIQELTASSDLFKPDALIVHPQEDEKGYADTGERDDSDGGLSYEDDENDSDWDPGESAGKLWCICKKPHSNRFMICCDKCQGWFHGRCVGISKARGKEMEKNNEEYMCPVCKAESLGVKHEPDSAIKTDPDKSSITVKTEEDLGTVNPKAEVSVKEEPTQEKIVEDGKNIESSATTTSGEGPKEAQEKDKTPVKATKPKERSFLEAITGIPNATDPDAKVITVTPEKSPGDEQKPSTDVSLPLYKTEKSGEVKSYGEKIDKTLGEIKKRAAQMLAERKKKRFKGLKDHKRTFGTCIVEGCEAEARADSVYCSDQCIEKYSKESLKIIHQERERCQGQRRSSSSDPSKKTPTRVVVMERRSGRVLTGPSAPFESNLTDWLKGHPTFEVLRPSRASFKTSSFYKKDRNERDSKHSNISHSNPQSSSSSHHHHHSRHSSSTSSAHSTHLSQHGPGSSHHGPGSAHHGSGSAHHKSGHSHHGQGHPRHSSDSSRHGSDSSHHSTGHGHSSSSHQSKSSLGPSPAKDDAGPEPVRLNVRRSLRDVLAHRANEADDIMLSNSEIKKIALSIEEELYNLFLETGMKYKSKYRSLIFNIKDTKNKGLFRKILSGQIKAHQLVRMSGDELASKELAKWREMENKHALEMIELAEKEAQAEAGKVHVTKKTHKGVLEVEDEDLSSLTNVEVEEKKAPVTSPSRTVTGVPDFISSLIVDTTKQHRMHLFDLNCKVCTGKVAPPSNEETPSKKVRVARTVSKESKEDGLDQSKDDESMMEVVEEKEVKEALEVIEKVKAQEEEMADSNSVVIRSPDSALQSGLDIGPKGGVSIREPSLWKGLVHMQDIPQFVTSAFKVSGPTHNLTLPDCVELCGRIAPDQVWDYLARVKKAGSKDVCIIRFEPATGEEKGAYVELYSYLNSRSRCGVCGNNSKLVKDLYIVPLAAHSQVNPIILPFDGPGLVENRPHMLLGIAVMQKIKRHSEISTPELTIKSFPSDGPSAVKKVRHSIVDTPPRRSPADPRKQRVMDPRSRARESQLAKSSPLPAREPSPADSYSAEDTPPPKEPPKPKMSDPIVQEYGQADLGEEIQLQKSADPVPMIIEQDDDPYDPGDLDSIILKKPVAKGAGDGNPTPAVPKDQKSLLLDLTRRVEEQKRQIELKKLSVGLETSKVATPPSAETLNALMTTLKTATATNLLSKTALTMSGTPGTKTKESTNWDEIIKANLSSIPDPEPTNSQAERGKSAEKIEKSVDLPAEKQGKPEEETSTETTDDSKKHSNEKDASTKQSSSKDDTKKDDAKRDDSKRKDRDSRKRSKSPSRRESRRKSSSPERRSGHSSSHNKDSKGRSPDRRKDSSKSPDRHKDSKGRSPDGRRVSSKSPDRRRDSKGRSPDRRRDSKGRSPDRRRDSKGRSPERRRDSKARSPEQRRDSSRRSSSGRRSRSPVSKSSISRRSSDYRSSRRSRDDRRSDRDRDRSLSRSDSSAKESPRARSKHHLSDSSRKSSDTEKASASIPVPTSTPISEPALNPASTTFTLQPSSSIFVQSPTTMSLPPSNSFSLQSSTGENPREESHRITTESTAELVSASSTVDSTVENIKRGSEVTPVNLEATSGRISKTNKTESEILDELVLGKSNLPKSSENPMEANSSSVSRKPEEIVSSTESAERHSETSATENPVLSLPSIPGFGFEMKIPMSEISDILKNINKVKALTTSTSDGTADSTSSPTEQGVSGNASENVPHVTPISSSAVTSSVVAPSVSSVTLEGKGDVDLRRKPPVTVALDKFTSGKASITSAPNKSVIVTSESVLSTQSSTMSANTSKDVDFRRGDAAIVAPIFMNVKDKVPTTSGPGIVIPSGDSDMRLRSGDKDMRLRSGKDDLGAPFRDIQEGQNLKDTPSSSSVPPMLPPPLPPPLMPPHIKPSVIFTGDKDERVPPSGMGPQNEQRFHLATGGNVPSSGPAGLGKNDVPVRFSTVNPVMSEIRPPGPPGSINFQRPLAPMSVPPFISGPHGPGNPDHPPLTHEPGLRTMHPLQARPSEGENFDKGDSDHRIPPSQVTGSGVRFSIHGPERRAPGMLNPQRPHPGFMQAHESMMHPSQRYPSQGMGMMRPRGPRPHRSRHPMGRGRW